jgi:hypothetical protein
MIAVVDPQATAAVMLAKAMSPLRHAQRQTRRGLREGGPARVVGCKPLRDEHAVHEELDHTGGQTGRVHGVVAG